ncbi:MAG: fimbrillin family protein [Rikenellaceae bacterium]
MNKNLFFTLAMLVLACSCSKETEDVTPVTGDKVAVALESGQITARVSDEKWSIDDSIGVFMYTNTISSCTYSNTQYVSTVADYTSSSSSFNVVADTMFYPLNADKAYFVAYFPYNSATTNAKYSINVADQSNANAIDFMVSAEAEGSKTAPSVSLEFTHKLSMLYLTVTMDEGFGEQYKWSDVTTAIEGLATTAEYSFISKSISSVSDIASITPNGSDGSYSAILIPSANNADVKISFKVSGYEPFTYDISEAEFKEGWKYYLSLKITTTEVILTGSTIKDWATNEDIEDDNLTAE